MVEEGGRRSKP